MYENLIYQELKKLNATMEDISMSLRALAAKGETCDTCRHFHEGGCVLDHEREDGPYAPCVDECRACMDWQPGPNRHG